jgi:beta-catenin-like protein 1
MASEADLDAEIKGLSILSEHSEIYGCVGSLVSLLAHENADIAIDVVQIISELTDEDVEAQQEQWDALVNAMVSAVICITTCATKLQANDMTDGCRSYRAVDLKSLSTR